MIIGIVSSDRECAEELADIIVKEYVRFSVQSFDDAVRSSFCKAFNVTQEFISSQLASKDTPDGFQMNMRRMLDYWKHSHSDIKKKYWLEQVIPKGVSNDIVIPFIESKDELSEVKKHPKSIVLFTAQAGKNVVEDSIRQQPIGFHIHRSLAGVDGQHVQNDILDARKLIDEIVWNVGNSDVILYAVKNAIGHKI